MRNNHSYHYLLFQIHWDKILFEKLCYKLTEYKNSDQYDSKYLAFDKIIYEVMNSVAISSNRTAAAWESRSKWVKKAWLDSKIT